MKRFHILLMIFCSWAVLTAQIFDPSLSVKLQSTLDSLQQSLGYRGISASVIIPGHGTWEGSSGFSYDIVALQTDMRLAIYSITKTFTTGLAMKLVELGKLSLNDPVKKWLAPIQYVDPNITLKQLLSHRSGLYEVWNNPALGDSIQADLAKIWSPLEVLSFLQPPVCSPGSCFNYTTGNFLVVGMIIEKATGDQYLNQLRQYILDPLGLSETFLSPDEAVPEPIAHGWKGGTVDIYNDPREARWSTIWAGGALFSTAENTARYYQKLFSGQLVSQNSVSQMQNNELGIFQYSWFGQTVWAHIGAGAGYRAMVSYDEATGIATANLSNNPVNNQALEDVNKTLLKVTLDNLPPVETKTTLIRQDQPILFSPNPITKGVSLKLEGIEFPAGLILLNIHGKILRRWHLNENSVRWDGQDQKGHSLASGIYVFKYFSDVKNGYKTIVFNQ